MIRPLRTRHRWTVTLLAILIPLLFVLGLMARREVPTQEAPTGPAPAAERSAP